MHIQSPSDFHTLLCDLPQPDTATEQAARTRQAQLTKPPGSLGRLEDLACWLASWQGEEKPKLERIEALVFAGNHGVTAQGVSAFPAEVTVQMVANFNAGGAAINQLCEAVGARLSVIAMDLDRPTIDFTQDAAMSEDECLDALNVGLSAVAVDADALILGEMGIGNTTVASALAAGCFGGRGTDWAGPGTGLDADAVRLKAHVIDKALDLHMPQVSTAFEMLCRLSGREQAAMAGAILAARMNRIAVVLDGFVCSAAAGVLAWAQPNALEHCIAGHMSAEPGHQRMLRELKLEPLLSLGMRLREGSGAAVAMAVLKAAVATHNGMTTFAEAGVSNKEA